MKWSGIITVGTMRRMIKCYRAVSQMVSFQSVCIEAIKWYMGSPRESYGAPVIACALCLVREEGGGELMGVPYHNTLRTTPTQGNERWLEGGCIY